VIHVFDLIEDDASCSFCNPETLKILQKYARVYEDDMKGGTKESPC